MQRRKKWSKKVEKILFFWYSFEKNNYEQTGERWHGIRFYGTIDGLPQFFADAACTGSKPLYADE